MVFGLAITLNVFGVASLNGAVRIALLPDALASVAVREGFQALANVVRFPMVFAGGVFAAMESGPEALQWLARALPLT